MKKLLFVLILIGGALVGVAYYLNSSATTAAEVDFKTEAVEYGDITEVVSATGQLSPREVTLVSSQVGGLVEKVYREADFNYTVEANQPLLELDKSQAELKLKEAKDAITAAEADVARAEAARNAAKVGVDLQKELQAKDIGQKSNLKEAEYQLESAEAAVKAAKAKVHSLKTMQSEAQLGIEKMTVRAIAPGIIVDKKVFLGQMVGPQATEPLFKIASDLKHMKVIAQVAEGDISKVRPGLDAEFTVYAYSEGNVRFTGKVSKMHYLPNNIQGAVFYNTIIDVVNRPVPGVKDEWMLRPGMTATVDVITRRHAGAWKVPTAALNFQLEEAYQTPEARAKLAEWHQKPDRDDWKSIWVLNAQRKPWPVFVRIGGTAASGEPGIKDGQFNEVLEWDPEVHPEPKKPATYPQGIISAPPATKPSIFDRPNRIIS